MPEFLSLFFYQISLRLYRVAISIVSVFNNKAKLWIKGRKNWQAQLKSLNPNQKTVWFHTASLGEFEQARPIIEKFKSQDKSLQVLVTFFSPSGFEVRKNDPLADLVCYLPLDTKKNAKQFVALVNPALAVFVRYEFWPNFMDQLRKTNTPTAVVSAHFRKGQFLFKPLGEFIKNRIQNLDKILVQYPGSKSILMENGFDENKIKVCGDSRIDRVLDISKEKLHDPILEAFVQDKKVLVLGSSYTDEESFTFTLMEKEKDLKIIIAPHYVDENNVNRIIGSTPVKTMRYTQAAANQDFSKTQVMVLDTMGMLAAVYQYGHFALVGGGFKDGIHSILEPAAFGLPLFFGPYHHSFTEANGVINAGGGFEITDQESFLKVFLPLLENETLRQEAGEKVLDFIKSHEGASGKIVAELQEML